MSEQFFVRYIDLDLFPRELILKYGFESVVNENREWYAHCEGKNSIVIQRFGNGPFGVMFVQDGVWRALEVDHEPDVDAAFPVFVTLVGALEALRSLGFNPKIKRRIER